MLALASLTLGAGGLAAQEIGPPEIGIAGGVMDYDFRGEGSTPFGALRVRFPMGRWLVIEPSFGYAAFTADEDAVSAGAGRDVKLVLAEFQLQGQYPMGRLSAFLGLGLGGAVDFRDERGADDFVVSTFSGAGGLAVALGRGWSARGEVRARTLDETADSATEYTIGLAVAF